MICNYIYIINFITIIKYIYNLKFNIQNIYNILNLLKCINKLNFKYINNSILNLKYTKLIYTESIIHKLISCKIISKLTKNGICKKYSIISIIGNKNGWLGIGNNKNINLYESIDNSFKNSFNKIYYINNLNNYLYKFNIIKYRNDKFILYTNIFNINKNNNLINLLFNIIGIKNIHFKCVKNVSYNNILNVVKNKFYI